MTVVCVNKEPEFEAPEADVRRRLRVAPPGRSGLRAGQGGVVPPAPQDCLARVAVTESAVVWWLGVHGGAGESTLEELFSGSRAAGHAWPLATVDEPPARVVLVARTHARGLRAAQCAMREWAAGEVPVSLLGLVLIADAPGRLPHALRQLADVVAGGVPAVWWLPWIEAWRVGEAPGPANAPKVARRLLEDLRAMTEPGASVDAKREEPQ